jgi:hypothetical protein
MKVWNSLKTWWSGVQPSITETETGGYRLRYQNPNHPPARVRFKAAAMRAAFIKGAIGAIAVAVAAAAIIKWLGLS